MEKLPVGREQADAEEDGGQDAEDEVFPVRAVGVDGAEPHAEADLQSDPAEVEDGSRREEPFLAVRVGRVVHALHPGDGA